jgi:hypothetical protein
LVSAKRAEGSVCIFSEGFFVKSRRRRGKEPSPALHPVLYFWPRALFDHVGAALRSSEQNMAATGVALA